MFGIVLAYAADQKSVNDYGKHKLCSLVRSKLHSLTVQNKSATDFWVQVYNLTAANEAAANTAADLLVPEFEVICPGGLYVPFNFPGGWRFSDGVYVRCVSVVDGASGDLIGADDAKITASFMDGF